MRRPSLSLFLALAGPLLAKHPSLDSATVQMLSPTPEPLKRRAPCKLACAFAEGKQLLSAMLPAAPDDPSPHVCLRKPCRSCRSHTGVAGSVQPPGECVCKWSVRWSLFSLSLSSLSQRLFGLDSHNTITRNVPNDSQHSPGSCTREEACESHASCARGRRLHSASHPMGRDRPPGPRSCLLSLQPTLQRAVTWSLWALQDLVAP